MLPGNASLRDLRDRFVCEIKLTQMPFSGPKKKQIYSQGLKYKVACCTKLLCCQDTGGVSRNRTLALLKPLMEVGKFSVFDVLF